MKDNDKPKDQKQEDKAQKKDQQTATGSDEAKAMLEKMQAKKDAGDCPFC
jgi:hypothetical protein